MAKILKGICPILDTPFTKNGDVDYDSLQNEVKFMSENGCHGLTLFGIAGEYYKLLEEEQNHMVKVVIDEAHVFIDEKYPIALDFMFQLAKRIRKYNGMQIIITQNIKDFVGTEEIARKSTAIINACQYSFIFALAPNDMHDLCKLYEKAGEINESEQEKIINNGRGQAFVVTSPTSRTSIEIVAAPEVEELFS